MGPLHDEWVRTTRKERSRLADDLAMTHRPRNIEYGWGSTLD